MIVGTLEAIWKVGRLYHVQILAPYRRYTFHCTPRGLGQVLNAYIGDKVEVHVNEVNEITCCKLFQAPVRVIQPDLNTLSVLAELSEIM